jgi:hypothetical protein
MGVTAVSAGDSSSSSSHSWVTIGCGVVCAANTNSPYGQMPAWACLKASAFLVDQLWCKQE